MSYFGRFLRLNLYYLLKTSFALAFTVSKNYFSLFLLSLSCYLLTLFRVITFFSLAFSNVTSSSYFSFGFNPTIVFKPALILIILFFLNLIFLFLFNFLENLYPNFLAFKRDPNFHRFFFFTTSSINDSSSFSFSSSSPSSISGFSDKHSDSLSSDLCRMT